MKCRFLPNLRVNCPCGRARSSFAWGGIGAMRERGEHPEVRVVRGYLAVFSGALFLVSAWMLEHAYQDARKFVPLQFADELSSRYYMMYVLFNRTIPLAIRRRIAVGTALWMVALAGFAAVAYLSGNPVIAVFLLMICGVGVANTAWQWRSARR